MLVVQATSWYAQPTAYGLLHGSVPLENFEANATAATCRVGMGPPRLAPETRRLLLGQLTLINGYLAAGRDGGDGRGGGADCVSAVYRRRCEVHVYSNPHTHLSWRDAFLEHWG